MLLSVADPSVNFYLTDFYDYAMTDGSNRFGELAQRCQTHTLREVKRNMITKHISKFIKKKMKAEKIQFFIDTKQQQQQIHKQSLEEKQNIIGENN